MPVKFDITAIAFFSFAVILFIFNCGPGFASENRRFIKEFTKYQTQEDDEEEEEEEDDQDIKAES